MTSKIIQVQYTLPHIILKYIFGPNYTIDTDFNVDKKFFYHHLRAAIGHVINQS